MSKTKPTRGGKRPGAGRKPTTGQSPLLSVRVSREVLRACEDAAAREGVSLPDWVRARLSDLKPILIDEKRAPMDDDGLSK